MTVALFLRQSLLPHKANVGNDAQSVMQFTNQGGSTASHVSLQTTFSPGVTVKAIRLLKNGVTEANLENGRLVPPVDSTPLEPVVATVVAWIWLRESLSAAQLAGAAVVLGGIALAQTAR